jgi:predicted membrane protein
METTTANRRAILGIFLVLLGAFFLLDNFGIIPSLPWWVISWQMLLIVIGVFNLITGNRSAAIILIGIGGIFLFTEFYPFSFRDWWPLILVIIGLSFIFRQKTMTKGSVFEENYFDSLNVFGGGNQRVTSHKLEGGKVTAIFGGADIDLRDSRPVDGATIDIFALFGGCEIKVPADWNIKSTVSPILGGFADNRPQQNNSDGPVVYLKGTAIFGGAEIK